VATNEIGFGEAPITVAVMSGGIEIRGGVRKVGLDDIGGSNNSS